VVKLFWCKFGSSDGCQHSIFGLIGPILQQIHLKQVKGGFYRFRFTSTFSTALVKNSLQPLSKTSQSQFFLALNMLIPEAARLQYALYVQTQECGVWSAPPRPQGIKVGKKRFAKEILECY
jgi:hypothetical protein